MQLYRPIGYSIISMQGLILPKIVFSIHLYRSYLADSLFKFVKLDNSKIDIFYRRVGSPNGALSSFMC